MKSLHSFSLKFFLIGLIALFLIPLLDSNFQEELNGKEIYIAINKSLSKQNQTKVLLIGDSVANQLFNNESTNGAVNSLACNQAISMVGHYILLKNYLEKNESVDKVVLMYHPQSLANNLDQVFTFHYFLKPFDKREYRPLFSNLVKDQIRSIPFALFSQLPIINRSNYSPEFEGETRPWEDIVSPVSREYLAKMKKLTDQKGIDFNIVSPPVKSAMKDSIARIDDDLWEDDELQLLFKNYLDNIEFIEDRYFVDEIHFIEPKDFSEHIQL